MQDLGQLSGTVGGGSSREPEQMCNDCEGICTLGTCSVIVFYMKMDSNIPGNVLCDNRRHFALLQNFSISDHFVCTAANCEGPGKAVVGVV